MPKIFITGATGTVGTQLIPVLARRGADVRVGVRSPDKARHLAELGAEVVRFDLEDRATVHAALAGVDRLGVIMPPFLVGSPAEASLVGAAREAGVRFVTRLSTIGATADGLTPMARHHAAADERVRTSGLDWTLIKPTFFMDNLLTYSIDSIHRDGAFYGAAGDGKASWVSSRDIAEVAAAALLDPSAHRGQDYELTGPEALSSAEVAALASEVAGRTIRYVDIPAETLRSNLIAAGTPAAFADGIVTLEALKASGKMAAVSPNVERILGRPGERYRDFLLRNRARLA